MDRLALSARLVADFHSQFHHEEVEEDFLHHSLGRYLLVNDVIFAKLVYRISDAVVRVELYDEEKDEYLHILVIIEHQVYVAILHLN